ncbi:hypothetical protein E2C01_000502 [Portunus trituberculatus]|uniref:Uncharacterized protein n=1 Tax=Portunus trituberculatus TaxID=210409 RepID=A0A5B7CJX4_PORTR|nr:hypothetical protein [Portunus trituberculatus]
MQILSDLRCFSQEAHGLLPLAPAAAQQTLKIFKSPTLALELPQFLLVKKVFVPVAASIKEPPLPYTHPNLLPVLEEPYKWSNSSSRTHHHNRSRGVSWWLEALVVSQVHINKYVFTASKGEVAQSLLHIPHIKIHGRH